MSTNIQLLSAIRPSDIPAEYADLVEVLGLDGFLTLVDLCDGQFELMLVPVPKTPLQLQRTIRAIVYEEYETSNALIFRHVRHVTAESDGSIPWTLDGEYAPGVPKIEIGIEDNGIQMMI